MEDLAHTEPFKRIKQILQYWYDRWRLLSSTYLYFLFGLLYRIVTLLHTWLYVVKFPRIILA